MSEASKTSVKKAFKAPIMKISLTDDKTKEDNHSQNKVKKIKQQNLEKGENSKEDKICQKKEKKTKNQNLEKGENSKEDKISPKKDKKTKNQPQVSLTDSQYEDIFEAVLKEKTSQHNTPEEVLMEKDTKYEQSTPSKHSKDGTGKPISAPVTPSCGSSQSLSTVENTPEYEVPDKKFEESTPSKHSKVHGGKPISAPTTPAQRTKSLPPLSPWGSHFSKQASQGSSDILKELQETQSSLLNSSSLLSDSSSVTSDSNGQSELVLNNKQNQRERLENLQRLRNVGLWVFCDRETCQKQRYLPHVTDPQELPDVWYCQMNPDPKFNSCQCEEQLPSAEEEEDMIFNSFTAGSVVWARVPGYPWWPAMVDDDPDLEQYYWLLEDFVTVTHYHVVFFDEGSVTRAWVDLKNIAPYAKQENKYKIRSCRGIDFSRRIQVAKKQASKALSMTSYKRLTVYSFIARYEGPICTSPQKAQRTVKKYKLKTKKVKQLSTVKESSKKGRKSSVTEADKSKKDKTQKNQGKSMKRKQGGESFIHKSSKLQKVDSEVNSAELYVATVLSKEPKTVNKGSNELNENHSECALEETSNSDKDKTNTVQNAEEIDDDMKFDTPNIDDTKISTTKTEEACVETNTESETICELVNTEDTIGVVEPSEESKHSLSQSTIVEFLAAESEDGIVPEVSGFSQSSIHSLPFEE